MNEERTQTLHRMEAALGYRFADLGLLDNALTHRSFVRYAQLAEIHCLVTAAPVMFPAAWRAAFLNALSLLSTARKRSGSASGGTGGAGAGVGAGAGAGGGASPGMPGAGGSGATTTGGSGAPNLRGATGYDPVYAPSLLGGEGGPRTEAPGDAAGAGGDTVETPDSPLELGAVRPYDEVYGRYESSARESLARQPLPPSLQGLVQRYFSAIDPGQ